MRGWSKLFILGALLSAILIISVVYSSGVIDVLNLSLGSSSTTGGEAAILSTPLVFAETLSDSSKQSGNTTQIDLNVTGVTNLFAWQANISWDTSILNLSKIVAGEFLNRVTPPNYTTSSPAPNGLGYVINVTDNAAGCTAAGESILGGVPGTSGDGQMVSLEFLVVGYGSTNITINISGDLPTTLLNSSLGTITYDKTDGYFRNKYPGDVDGDKYVGSADFSRLAGAYGVTIGVPAYDREADFDLDGYIGSADFSALAGNYGKTFP
jgi:hypothetical protein